MPDKTMATAAGVRTVAADGYRVMREAHSAGSRRCTLGAGGYGNDDYAIVDDGYGSNGPNKGADATFRRTFSTPTPGKRRILGEFFSPNDR